ncbi:DNA-binding protein [Fructilactobacillus myrtifloralis]|uniref:DNA-binding protein n=1 Tax=Fructilactobacillus myrtifloralis TaxID=2940301 RepID=A0ABY5BRX2_9LACO|nr:DNA-binding protein [Fructilactobacillus myrtifloralis]USS85119.1 DNA-binding protein [Fructilactobacillus myrtifloralis]
MKIKAVPRDELPESMNYKQALQWFNIGSYNTLYDFIAEGLPVTVIGNVKRISKTNAQKFWDEHTK